MLASPLTLFIAQALALIVAARILGSFARRLQQPLVIAEMVAGIALGPSLFGWLLPGAYQALFPAQSLGTLQSFSQVGLMLFMFLVGLEFDPTLIKDRARSAIAIGTASILVPCALGWALAVYLYPRTSASGVPESSFAPFMSVAMSITAFPVLARILIERGLMRSRIGSIAIACAAFGDAAAWCILAVVVAMVRATELTGAVYTTVLAILYLATVVCFVRPALKWLFERGGSEARISQNLFALAIVLLLLSSSITENIGIHALFGAFLSGIAIPKERGLARDIANKLEDLVVVLLMPLFFAYSGLRTELGLLAGAESWLQFGLIVLVACLGKFGGCAVAARATGLSWREASAIGVLMNTRGLMELVVLNVGLDLGVISPRVFTMMVLMAIATTVVTTPLLERIYPAHERLDEPTDAPQAGQPHG